MSRGAFVCATLRYRKEFRSTKPNWPMDDSDTQGGINRDGTRGAT